MTNSTAAKDKKPKGPIRFEAIIPALIIFGLIYAYFHFFFDGNIRKAIEWGGTAIHGAEINVGRVKTSFWGGSFELNDLAVTDKNKPQRNIFEIGTIRFQFIWDALLRAKFVVQDASITGIQALSPRKSPGYVIPPPPPGSPSNSGIQKVQEGVLDQAKSDYNENLLGDLATVLGGVSPEQQLKAIEGQLKSSVRLNELEAELKEKEKVWKERLKQLPQGKEFEALGAKLKTLKFDAKNPIEFANSVKEAEKIIKEADQKIRLVGDTGKSLNQDVDAYSKAFKDLERMVDEDLKDLQARLKLPNVDAQDFSKSLFLKMFSDRLASVLKYAAVAKKYMPPPKDKSKKDEEEVIPRERAAGRNYRFPITKGYPLFWLKKAEIQSTVSPNVQYSGNIQGELRDVTTNPKVVGRPMVLELQGDFPQEQIKGLNLKVTVDNTEEPGRQDLMLKIGSYPTQELKLSDSKDVRLILSEATGGLDLNASLVNDQINLNMTNAFTQIKYDINAQNDMVREVLNKVFADIPMIDVKAKASGPWDKLNFSLSSNLGEELSKGFRAQVQAKIDQAKLQLRSLIDEKIGKQKKQLEQELGRVKGQVDGEVAKAQAEADKAKKTAQSEVDKQKSKGGTKKLEEEGKKLLKKLKIGG